VYASYPQGGRNQNKKGVYDHCAPNYWKKPSHKYEVGGGKEPLSEVESDQRRIRCIKGVRNICRISEKADNHKKYAYPLENIVYDVSATTQKRVGEKYRIQTS